MYGRTGPRRQFTPLTSTSLTTSRSCYAQQLAIQTEANRIVHSCKAISKGFMAKDEAEKLYGFHLYQGRSGTRQRAASGQHSGHRTRRRVVAHTLTTRVRSV